MNKKLKLITESNLENFRVITESEGAGKPQTIKMEGVYIVSEAKNGNGRIYRYDDLKPTVDKFIEEKINTKTALEELEHPECQLSPNFEILTPSGFVWFNDLKAGDLVWTRNPVTKKAELKPIKKIVADNYRGNGYIVSGKNIYGEFTANHRMVTEDRHGNLEIRTIEEIYNDRSRFHNNKIPKTLDISDDSAESQTFAIPAVASFAASRLKKANGHDRFEKDLVIDKNLFCKLFGFWLAEGGSRIYSDDEGNPTGGFISITQSIKANLPTCNLIDDLFNQLPEELKSHSSQNVRNDGTMKVWRISDLRLAKYFHDCGNIYTKRIPAEILSFGKEYLRNLVYFYGLGDGRKTMFHFRKYDNILLDNIHDVFSTSEGLVDDLSYCILKCGISTAKRCVVNRSDRRVGDRTIKAGNCKPLFVASILTSPSVCMDRRSLKIEKISVTEDDPFGAYCIQVENTSFFMRNRGKCYWTGNCVTINPDRVCAKTISLKEDNKSWIGTSVVLASDEKYGIKGTKCGDLLKSLLQFDVACGHSSRGVGNVNESTGVVEDYQLVCIDTVLNPSIGIFNKSNCNRFVNGILESKNFIVNTHGDILEEAFDGFEKKISKMPNTAITKEKVEFLGNAILDFFDAFRK